MTQTTYVGFGFGAIQAGLLLYEAHQSRNFAKLTVAEVVPETVDALRRAGGYSVNIALTSGLRRADIAPVEVLNPMVPADREVLIQRLAAASEIGTALPSVKFFGNGTSGDVVDILRQAFRQKLDNPSLPAAVVYTAENNNHAAELLWQGLTIGPGSLPADRLATRVQCLNTVIGKMCGIVNDPQEMVEQKLAPAIAGGSRAFLVEEFNRILISRVHLPGFIRGISVFEEKEDLLPFEEAKLYGHNASHALLGYLLWKRGCSFISDAASHPDLLAITRKAYADEVGLALCRKHRGIDSSFDKAAFESHVDAVITRMINPHLRDRVDRISRDPRRKLGWDDRLIGAIRLALGAGIEPLGFISGARAALDMLLATQPGDPATTLRDIWLDASASTSEKDAILQRITREKA